MAGPQRGRSREVLFPYRWKQRSIRYRKKQPNLRSTSTFGLCYIRIIFDDDVDDAFARQQVLSRLGNADLPKA